MLEAASASKTVYSAAKQIKEKFYTQKTIHKRDIKHSAVPFIEISKERKKNIKNHFSVDPEETFLRARKFFETF